MAKKDRYLVALDIGSTKTCALIADIEDGGAQDSWPWARLNPRASRKGLIVNLDAAVSSIRRALEEAEGVAGVPVESAVVGVAGSHVRGVNSRGGIVTGRARRATSNAKTCAAPWTPRAPSRFPKTAKFCTCSRRNFWSTSRTASAIPSAWSGRSSK